VRIVEADSMVDDRDDRDSMDRRDVSIMWRLVV